MQDLLPACSSPGVKSSLQSQSNPEAALVYAMGGKNSFPKAGRTNLPHGGKLCVLAPGKGPEPPERQRGVPGRRLARGAADAVKPEQPRAEVRWRCSSELIPRHLWLRGRASNGRFRDGIWT